MDNPIFHIVKSLTHGIIWLIFIWSHLEKYEEYSKCDAVIIASPTYYRNVTAQLKAVFDRTYATKTKKPLEGKVGGAIAVGRGQDGGQSIVC